VSNVHYLPLPAVRALPDDSIRADCERLMRRLAKDKRIPRERLHLLADILDPMIETIEGRND